jgi:4-carboxymuconolactone decarboxylase
MADSERRQRGIEMLKEVYAGDVVVPSEGYAFTDVMLEQVFAEVWSRDVLSIRDRRLLLLGIIAEKGEATTFGIQAKAALKRGELTPDELRELLLMIAQYSGYPRAAGLIGTVEQKIAEFSKEKDEGKGEEKEAGQEG